MSTAGSCIERGQCGRKNHYRIAAAKWLASCGFFLAQCVYATPLSLSVVVHDPAQVGLRPGMAAKAKSAVEAKIIATPTDGKSDHETLVFEVDIPGEENIDLPTGLWSLDIDASGYWGQREVIWVGEETKHFVLELWPTGQLEGTLKVPEKETAPTELEVHFDFVEQGGPTMGKSPGQVPFTRARLRGAGYRCCPLPRGWIVHPCARSRAG